MPIVDLEGNMVQKIDIWIFYYFAYPFLNIFWSDDKSFAKEDVSVVTCVLSYTCVENKGFDGI